MLYLKNNTTSNMRYNRKNILIVFGVIAATIIIILLFSYPFMNYIIKPKILKGINNDNNFELNIDNLSYNILSNSFNFSNSNFRNNQSSNNNINFSINATDLSIQNINWLKYIFNDEFVCRSIEISNPSIKIDELKSKSDKKNSNNNKSFNVNSLKQIPIKFNKLEINNGKYVRRNSNQLTVDSIKSFNVIVEDFREDISDKDSKLFSDLSLNIKDAYKLLPEEGYILKIGKANVSPFNSSIKIKSINFEPYISDEEFFSRKKYRTDRYKIDINSLIINDFNFSRFINNRDLITAEINLSKFYVDILTPKDIPVEPYYNPQMPNENFRDINSKIDINKILITKGNIVVEVSLRL